MRSSTLAAAVAALSVASSGAYVNHRGPSAGDAHHANLNRGLAGRRARPWGARIASAAKGSQQHSPSPALAHSAAGRTAARGALQLS